MYVESSLRGVVLYMDLSGCRRQPNIVVEMRRKERFLGVRLAGFNKWMEAGDSCHSLSWLQTATEAFVGSPLGGS